MQYSFKYLPKNFEYVYYPTTGRRVYYTTRFRAAQNVLTFYEHPHLLPIENPTIEKMTIYDVKHLTSVLHMDALIVSNAYCDLTTKTELQEIYYIREQPYKII